MSRGCFYLLHPTQLPPHAQLFSCNLGPRSNFWSSVYVSGLPYLPRCHELSLIFSVFNFSNCPVDHSAALVAAAVAEKEEGEVGEGRGSS